MMLAKKKDIDAVFYDCCSFGAEERIRLAAATAEERRKATIPVSQVNQNDVLKHEPMTLLEHTAVVLFLALGVPNGVVTIPALTFLVGKYLLGSVSKAFLGLGIILLPLTILPQPFVKSTLHSWIAVQVSRYFSFRLISEEYSDAVANERPQIFVAPPHGVFPYGNLASMLAWPSYSGDHFMGLASSAALRPPVFKQLLCSIGVIDASRESALSALQTYPRAIGISTGGVAEVFETNGEDECILLRERIGAVKLAIRTGADLVPCYIFGNTKLLSCWAGEGVPGMRRFLEKISRKIGFALIFFYGRLGLPIPHRGPLLAVKGRAIRTDHLKSDDPSQETVELVQNELIQEMQGIFDRYKHLYNWKEKRLIIK
jgi:Diacylglycerol acyltransferase